jgi:hypothetical protein
MVELVERSRRIRWVWALDLRQIEQESCLALAAGLLYDYLSPPLDAERIALILGHAYDAEVEGRPRASDEGSGSSA